MSVTRLASCSCGQLRAAVVGEPVRISICHCLECQRRTGSVFGVQARFPGQAVTTSGGSSTYVRVGSSGANAQFHFCPNCGSTVFYKLGSSPEHIGIPIGAFADPAFPTPKHSVFEKRMHSWVTLPAHIEHLP